MQISLLYQDYRSGRSSLTIAIGPLLKSDYISIVIVLMLNMLKVDTIIAVELSLA